MTPYHEREGRKFRRISLGNRGDFRLCISDRLSSWGNCKLTNISVGGAQIETPLKFPVMDPEMKVLLRLNFNKPYIFRANVLWCKQGNSKCTYGLQWDLEDSMDNELLQAIGQLMDHRKKRNVYLGLAGIKLQ